MIAELRIFIVLLPIQRAKEVFEKRYYYYHTDSSVLKLQARRAAVRRSVLSKRGMALVRHICAPTTVFYGRRDIQSRNWSAVPNDQFLNRRSRYSI